jgi:hypothetical protein
MNRILTAVFTAIGFALYYIGEVLGTRTGRLLIRLLLMPSLVLIGITLIRRDNPFNDALSNSWSFWTTAGLGLLLLGLALIIAINTFFRPWGRELRAKGLRLSWK